MRSKEVVLYDVKTAMKTLKRFGQNTHVEHHFEGFNYTLSTSEDGFLFKDSLILGDQQYCEYTDDRISAKMLEDFLVNVRKKLRKAVTSHMLHEAEMKRAQMIEERMHFELQKDG